MKILNRYILKEFSRFFAITLSAFLVLFLIGDFIEKVDDYVEQKALAADVIRFMLYQVPNIAFMVMPLAVLLSTLLSLGILSKNGEYNRDEGGRIAAPSYRGADILYRPGPLRAPFLGKRDRDSLLQRKGGIHKAGEHR